MMIPHSASVALVVCTAFASCTQFRNVQVTDASASKIDATPDDSDTKPEPTPSSAPTSANASVQSGRVLTSAERTAFLDPAFKRRMLQQLTPDTDVEPQVSDRDRQGIVAVVELLGKNDLEAAESRARALRGEDESASSPAVDFIVAYVLEQRGKSEEAIATYLRATEKFPKFRRAWSAMADAAIRSSDFDNAAKAASRVIALGGGDGSVWGILGVAHFKSERYVAAESAFRMATSLDPERANWVQGLAESFFAQERYADAAALLDPLIRAQPDSPELWLAQGRAFANLDDWQRAAENFEVVDSLGAAEPRTLSLLGGIYAKQELFGMSARAYLRAIRAATARSERRPIREALEVARYMIGADAYDEVRDLLAGIAASVGEDTDASLTLEEQQALLRVRASLAVATGDGNNEHEQILRELIALDPLDAQALILLGRKLGKDGKNAEAYASFERAAGIDKFRAEAQLRHAELLVRERDYREALPLLKSAYELRPRDDVKSLLQDVERLARSQN